MRTTRLIASAAAGAAALTAFGAVMVYAADDPAPATQADPQLAADLQFMQEEERLSGDLYKLFAERYPQATVFANIARSEDRHAASVARQAENFSVADLGAGLEPGDYAFDELDELYATLAGQGETLQGAIKAGIAVEEEDIANLEDALARPSSEPVARTFAALLAASENHLQAFNTALENDGVCDCAGEGSQNRQGMDNGEGRVNPGGNHHGGNRHGNPGQGSCDGSGPAS